MPAQAKTKTTKKKTAAKPKSLNKATPRAKRTPAKKATTSKAISKPTKPKAKPVKRKVTSSRRKVKEQNVFPVFITIVALALCLLGYVTMRYYSDDTASAKTPKTTTKTIYLN